MVTKASDSFSIVARAPTRIDLAGGTLDLWPLYLFLDSPTTLNLGIDLYAEASLEAQPDSPGGVHLRSADQGIELALEWTDLSTREPKIPPALELHFRLLSHLVARAARPPRGRLHLETRALSPAGAGLGGSSALAIAILGALCSWAEGRAIDPEREGEKLIEIARDVETTVIQVPAGVQDYYGAAFGGLQSLRWGTAGNSRRRLAPELMGALAERMLLFYSGQSRNSGINNWALFKSFIDREDGTREKFSAISEAARALEVALERRDWDDAGRAIAREWETRRTLAPGITTPPLDEAFARARALAPIAGKVCGAGGGGCFFIYSPELAADRGGLALRETLGKTLAVGGIRPLPFRPTPAGLTLERGKA